MYGGVREQLPLWRSSGPAEGAAAELRDAAAAENKSWPVHRWAPWIAGFSAPFVQDVIEGYLPERNRSRAVVLDPFAGVATTLVEALKAGCNAAGYEINGFAALVGRAKVNCVDVEPSSFRGNIDAFRGAMLRFESQVDKQYLAEGAKGLEVLLGPLRGVAPPRFKSRIAFFSPAVEAKFLYALDRAQVLPEPVRSLFQTALGATMVSYSNYSYEPSLSSRPGAGKPIIENASVGLAVLRKLSEMLDDIQWVRQNYGSVWRNRSRDIHHGSYFQSEVKNGTVSLLVTSPPYMNNYHYVRNTRPQLYWLGLALTGTDLRDLEHASFGKFWQTVRQGPRVGLTFDFPELSRAIEDLSALNVEKQQYGGPGWANYVATYFNDSYRFLEVANRQLRNGAYALVVVGNSIIQGMEFKVDHLLAQMAEQVGLKVHEIRIVRTKRVGNSIIDSAVRNGHGEHAQRTQLYDAAVILRA